VGIALFDGGQEVGDFGHRQHQESERLAGPPSPNAVPGVWLLNESGPFCKRAGNDEYTNPWPQVLNFFGTPLVISGSADNPKEEFLVLGGVCIYERQVSYFTRELDSIANRIRPGDADSIEFHASEIFSGRQETWKSMSKDQRREVIKEVLGVLATAYDSACGFACAVHKKSYPSRHPMEIAFEDLCSRFDKFLQRKNEKGLMILDESTHETTLLRMAHDFRRLGTQWNAIRNIVDATFFVTSRAFRCVQVAGHVAYSVFRRYEAKDTNYLDIILPRFDSDGKVIHGLRHVQIGLVNCMCHSCLSRR
jgi:hypothetical protein